MSAKPRSFLTIAIRPQKLSYEPYFVNGTKRSLKEFSALAARPLDRICDETMPKKPAPPDVPANHLSRSPLDPIRK
jgi:hypothetical protein